MKLASVATCSLTRQIWLFCHICQLCTMFCLRALHLSDLIH